MCKLCDELHFVKVLKKPIPLNGPRLDEVMFKLLPYVKDLQKDQDALLAARGAAQFFRDKRKIDQENSEIIGLLLMISANERPI